MRYRRRELEESSMPPIRRRRRGLGVVPTLFTLGNCLCGFASLHYASQPVASTAFPTPFAIACYLIFLAMIFDMFDGFMARLTKTSSDFGAELDSLADMVSFGVAPAYLALKVCGSLLTPAGPYEILGPFADDALGKLFWIIGGVYVACAALRLARFNVINKHDVDSHMSFRGLPSPGAAGVVVSTILFFEALRAPLDKHFIPFRVPENLVDNLKAAFPYLIPCILLAAALLMVSRFSYSHLINRFLRGRRRFGYVVRIVLLAGLIFWQPQITALAVIYLYALSAPAAWIFRSIFGKSAQPPSAPNS
jgi:CDP-diacylglycerol--serine O-phosphatidyltransferase